MHVERAEHWKRWGPVYWSVWLYRTTMTALRPQGRGKMYRLLADEISERSLLDLCCGDAELTRWVPQNRYMGIDKNPIFIKHVRQRSISIIEGDVLEVSWPPMDCLVMTDSLYQFLPDPRLLMDKILSYPCTRVIISESVDNLASSSFGWVTKCAEWATRVNGRSHRERFTDDSLRAFFNRYGFQRIIRTDKNLIGVLEKP